MNIWHDIAPERITPKDFIAYIEITKGQKQKYELDKNTGMLFHIFFIEKFVQLAEHGSVMHIVSENHGMIVRKVRIIQRFHENAPGHQILFIVRPEQVIIIIRPLKHRIAYVGSFYVNPALYVIVCGYEAAEQNIAYMPIPVLFNVGASCIIVKVIYCLILD